MFCSKATRLSSLVHFPNQASLNLSGLGSGLHHGAVHGLQPPIPLLAQGAKAPNSLITSQGELKLNQNNHGIIYMFCTC